MRINNNKILVDELKNCYEGFGSESCEGFTVTVIKINKLHAIAYIWKTQTTNISKDLELHF